MIYKWIKMNAIIYDNAFWSDFFHVAAQMTKGWRGLTIWIT